jgi:hypothetical protein
MTHSAMQARTKFIPAGPEREVLFLRGADLDGAPVAYVVVLAAVVTALSFVPASVTLGSGGSFPLSQGILPLLGWVLGPLAGAAATGVGTSIGVFVAPHTAGIPGISILGAIASSFFAGVMRPGTRRDGEPRSWWWIPVALVLALALTYLFLRAFVLNGVGVRLLVAATAANWSALLLFVLPTRRVITRWIARPRGLRAVAGLVLGTWMVTGLAHLFQLAIAYHMFNWPAEVWTLLVGFTPAEQVVRCLVGTVIGLGVLSGLRAIGLVKPAGAIY